MHFLWTLVILSLSHAHRNNFGPMLKPLFLVYPEPAGPVHSFQDWGIDMNELVITSQYTTDHNQVTHIYYNQMHNNLSITNAVANLNLDKDGNVLSLGHSLYLPKEDLNPQQITFTTVSPLDFQLTPLEAVEAFAKFLKLDASMSLSQEPPHLENVHDVTFQVKGFPRTRKSVPVLLKYLMKEDGSLSLVWDMVVDLHDNWYHAHVCALSGDILSLLDWVSDAAYRVFPLGTNDPVSGPRRLLVNPQHPIASPAGWHTLGSIRNGTRKPSRLAIMSMHKKTRGANEWLNNYRPSGLKSLVFDFQVNLTESPSTYLDAAITNLFYINNIIHDLFYVYGFDEKAGNFQEFNFNRGDGSGYNNANFATPPDGQKPRMRMYVWNVVSPNRDGDMESGIVIHEYAHGISIRLTGGPMNVGCLGWGESGGMGEGWGDFFATILRMTPNDTRNSVYSMGEYSLDAYSTSLDINPSTYAFINKPGYWGVHAKGEVWAEILYEVYWNVVDDHGFSPLWFNHPKTKRKSKKIKETYGNRMMLQNVVDGLKLQPCYPTFVDARDAIILADKINYKGINKCSLWRGFAKRGLGKGAEPGGTEDFSVPKECDEIHDA